MHFASATTAATIGTAAVTAAAAGHAAATAAAAGSTLCLTGSAAFRATIRLVLEAFAREKLLFSGTKNELTIAINAVQGFVSVQL